MPLIDLVDLLLLLVSQRSRTALLITAKEDGHHINFEENSKTTASAILPLLLGDALVARLCAIAGMDILGAPGRFGRIQVMAREHKEIFALGVRLTSCGLCAELCRLAEPNVGARGADFDAYEIQKELGRGGVGDVFLAKHKFLGRLVALKVLRDKSMTDDAERFFREARAAARVRHPCVVEIFDFGFTPDGRPFLVMEFIDGQTLRAQMAAPLNPTLALEIAYQIALALEAIHSAGIVHRDLKPENIFVDTNHNIKIVDFGTAKALTESDLQNITQEGTIVGTPFYMSPEHVQGKSVDHRADLYALGCLLFEILSGKHPYDRKTPKEVFLAHCYAPIPPLITSDKSPPLILQEIIHKSMAKDPNNRYQSASAMLVDLDRAKFAASRKGWRRWLPL